MVNSLSIPERQIGLAIFDSGVVHFDPIGYFWHVHRTHPELRLPPAPIFMDLGALPPELVVEIGTYLRTIALVMGIHFQRVAGVPTGGNGFAREFCIADRSNTFQQLTLQKTAEGIRGPVHGFYEPHDFVLPLEDVITTGASTLAAIEALEAEGFTIHDVMAVVDYGLGATELLKIRGIILHCIFPISRLLDLWFEEARITAEQCDRVTALLNELRHFAPSWQ